MSVCFFAGAFYSLAASAAAVDSSALEFATPQLSVRLIHALQTDLEAGSAVWMDWEKKRLSMLSELENWQQIIESIDAYPINIPAKEDPWFVLLKATAQLKMSHAVEVRNNIRQLIWSDYDLNTEQTASARRLIIRSYLAEEKSSDAQRAMLRYQQDYGDSGLQWKLLQTKVLLATQRYQQAARLIAKESDASVQPLKNLTRLKAGLDDGQYVFKQALQSAQQADTAVSQNIKRQNWILATIAAGLQQNYSAEIETLEQALTTGVADADKDLRAVNSALLWKKYRRYAEHLGNKYHLLTGDDEAWFKAASDRFDKEPVQARALFAYLGELAASSSHRELALEQLSLLINKSVEKGLALVEMLFSEQAGFSSVKKIPTAVRYQLVDYALSRGHIKRAASLFAFLPQPPQAKKRLAWDMRRARVLVLGGQYQQGAVVLLQLLKDETLDVENLNRLMQVIFDLQKIEQHRLAIDLFNAVGDRSNSAALQRELKFWTAESYQALQQYEKSAHLYLISASMIAEKKSDPWSQTARFKAAEVLSQAGLIDDARALLQQLLRNTKNDNRKAVIKQKLQQLWLLEGKQLGDAG
ncbi:MAG: hypothetical protein OEY36_02020 [Gammaproteobacteria bacterium]|nr:hypothetical protein [Gammaproteobacteria bacterium]